ncbi:1-deoxy-D-xylulose-5-phosphate synthase [Actinomycetaceae bacterium TAE3-ERU4]|nr:1-deoxy-D-xylulose-5-phosphate synthase [Actinomycetaceae bacterium TAE3-ERU4]
MTKDSEDFPQPSPLLSKLQGPEDLHDLTEGELNELAAQIREYLVSAVSRTGGHLGPNLGVVELTIALHAVFSSPQDSFIFDTGHQAYVHKLLTGRKDFSTLRQAGGLSGYPSRAESEHDIVENSHASTALSWAYGIAMAKKMKHDDSMTLAVIGDGALTGGMAWEALNNISSGNPERLLIVVNDNGRSYAPTIGGLSNHLNSVRTDPRYEQTLGMVKRALLSVGKPGEAAYEALKTIKRGVKECLAPQVMFEDLGLKYLGPIDGHDISQLLTTFKQVSNYRGPVIVHVRTAKGRGYVPAENDAADRFHAVGRIHPETGLPVAPSRFGWTSVFADEILALARENKKLLGVTAAMMAPVGLGPMSKEFPQRVIDVGIAEAHAATMCAGFAYAGYHPVFAVYATFLNRAFDQVLMDVALHRAGVTFVLDRAGATGDDGASHNGMWDIAMLRLVPGIRLAAPRDEQTLREALREAVLIDDAPSVVRYPKGSLPSPIKALESGKEKGKSYDLISQSAVDNETPRVLLIGTGPMVSTCESAKNLLPDLQIAVVDPRWLLPVADDLVEYASGFDLVVTVEDGLVEGGYGSALEDRLMRASIKRLEEAGSDFVIPKVVPLGIEQKFWPHTTRDQIHYESGMSAKKIAQIVRSICR